VATTGRVLLVGKRARALNRLAEALRREGLQVRQETEPDKVGSHVDASMVDVVALGRALTPARRETIVKTLRARNPSVRVVEGLAPITPLLLAQIQEALNTPARESRIVSAAGIEHGDRRVSLMLRRPANVTVDLHRLDPLYRAHEERVYSGQLDSGRHNLRIKGRVTAGERFLVVRADGQTTVHAVA
jgi:hypothetical protein